MRRGPMKLVLVLAVAGCGAPSYVTTTPSPKSPEEVINCAQDTLKALDYRITIFDPRKYVQASRDAKSVRESNSVNFFKALAFIAVQAKAKGGQTSVTVTPNVQVLLQTTAGPQTVIDPPTENQLADAKRVIDGCVK